MIPAASAFSVAKAIKSAVAGLVCYMANCIRFFSQFHSNVDTGKQVNTITGTTFI